MRHMLYVFLACLAIFTLSACGKSNPNTLVVGTIAGPETTLVEVARKIAEEKYGLSVKIVEFNDYNLPNEALDDGSLDLNIYQHKPYLDAAIAAHQYALEPVAKTFIYPLALYSKKHHKLNQLKAGAIIALPNDPSNEARALLLLKKHGLVRLKTETPNSTQDIQSNPRHFVFKEMDAALLPRSLDDVDAAVINTTFALPAGLSPQKDGLIVEDKDSPYINLIVAKKNAPKAEQIALFIKAFQSEAVREKAKELFGDAAIAGWK